MSCVQWCSPKSVSSWFTDLAWLVVLDTRSQPNRIRRVRTLRLHRMYVCPGVLG